MSWRQNSERVASPYGIGKRGKNVSPNSIATLVTKAMKRAREDAQSELIRPIVEFFKIDPNGSRQGRKMEIFPPASANERPYLKQLREELKKHHGIYIFYDSRGRALYVGKAQRLSLWVEMKNAFNRPRDVQEIMRVSHPQHHRVQFRTAYEMHRRIRRQSVP